MRLVALVDSPGHVCCRYRIEAFRRILEQAGHHLDVEALPRNWWARLLLYRRLQGANVILQRRLLPFWESMLLRNRVSRLVFDLDDAVFLRDSYSPRGVHHPRRWRRFVSLVQRCDAVVAGNAWLAQEVRRAAPQATTTVIPTCVDPAAYRTGLQSERPAMQLVWVGSSSTLQGIERVRPLLDSLARQVPGISLKIICDRFPHFERMPVVAVPWNQQTEADEIASSDVGISWIPEDDWSRGKCGLKVLQYMAAGLAVVANPVGVHPEMVQPGKTGFLVHTEGEWIAALRTLAEEPQLRQAMGQGGRKRVEQAYSVDQGGRRWLELLASLESSQRRAG